MNETDHKIMEEAMLSMNNGIDDIVERGATDSELVFCYGMANFLGVMLKYRQEMTLLELNELFRMYAARKLS